MSKSAGDTELPAGFFTSAPACEIPANACDCHTHVFGDPNDYPPSPDRHYNPGLATPDDLHAMLNAIRFDRVILVQPSAYGTDNRCLLDALGRFGNRARGIAVLSPDVTGNDLAILDRAGIRGCRINAPQSSKEALHAHLEALKSPFRRMSEIGWHVQFMICGAHFQIVERFLTESGSRIVLDHFGGPAKGGERPQDRIASLRRLLQTGRCWIKLSGPHRTGHLGNAETIHAIMTALAKDFPERLLWGSDWPHTATHGHQPVTSLDVSPFQGLDTGKLVESFIHTIGSERLATRILRDNPNQLFKWDS